MNALPWQSIIPISVLVASLVGSLHCVSMCGGLISLCAQTPIQKIQYHLARLIGYMSLGAVSGFLGKSTSFQMSQTLSWSATLILSSGFLWMGYQVWQGRHPHLFRLPSSWMAAFFKSSSPKPFKVGLLSAFLPCGWLHSFVLGATATQSPWAGSIFLLFFWIGTIPALSITPVAAKYILKPITQFSPRLSAILLILAGLANIGIRAKMLEIPQNHPPSHPHSCHD